MKVSLSVWRIPNGIRSPLAGVFGLLAAAYFLRFFTRIRPLEQWFFFDMAKLWLWSAVFSAACASVGLLVVRRLTPVGLRSPLLCLGLAFPAGVVVFMLGMYAGGFLHLWSAWFAVAFAALLIAAGARPALETWREARSDRAASRTSVLARVAQVLGVLLLGVLYLGAMSPDAINYDATWVHMVIPQDYARAGYVVPFPGDQVKNVPHMGAVLATWGFLVPGLDLPALRWMMALHIEFTVLLWTLVGVAAAARWLAERQVRGTWAALLLFPGIFVYDGNIGGASDHFLALFAVPMLLGAHRLMQRFEPSAAILGGLMAGGALASKYQAIYVIVPLFALASLRAAWLLLRRARGERALPSPATIAAGVGLTAGVALAVLLPHLLSNWVFYNNPVYPLLQNVFKHSTPTIPDAAEQVNRVLADWQWLPPKALDERVLKALEMAFTFSFEPHYSFVGNLPVFGSIFTLALPLLLVIERPRRLWFGAVIGLGAIFMWAMSYWVDRNLQTFLPLLVAAAAAILVRAWELGWLARGGVLLLVVAQSAWALPLYFSGTDRIVPAIELLKGGMSGDSRKRLERHRSEYVALGESLPQDAVVLLHNEHIMLGIDRPVIKDWVGFQTIIDYRTFKTARDLWRRLREIGVTHIVWIPGSFPAGTVQEDIIFHTLVGVYGGPRKTFGRLNVVALPAEPPPAEPAGLVLAVGLPEYPNGLYRVEGLSSCRYFPADMQRRGQPVRTAAQPEQLLAEAQVVVTAGRASSNHALSKSLAEQFQVLEAYGATYGNLRVHLRK